MRRPEKAVTKSCRFILLLYNSSPYSLQAPSTEERTTVVPYLCDSDEYPVGPLFSNFQKIQKITQKSNPQKILKATTVSIALLLTIALNTQLRGKHSS